MRRRIENRADPRICQLSPTIIATATPTASPAGCWWHLLDRRISPPNSGMFAGFVRLPVEGRDILPYSNADHEGHERIRLTEHGDEGVQYGGCQIARFNLVAARGRTDR